MSTTPKIETEGSSEYAAPNSRQRARNRYAGRATSSLGAPDFPGRYSHSIVPGGFEVRPSATRFTAGISLMIRVAVRARNS